MRVPASMRFTAAVLAIGSMLAAALWSAAPGSASALRWRNCLNGLQCTTIEVPVDYAKPDGAVWTIPVSRYPAATQPAPRGAILLNEGGPGLPGLAASGYKKAWSRLHEQYDMIGFDPRGTGSSVPAIECLTDRQKERIRGQVSAPTTAEQRRTARRLGRLQGQMCQKKWGEYLPHVGTENVARDMDRIREALGMAKISYMGFSYGTFLGAVYANLFPGRTDRVILDSAMNPALGYVALRRDQAEEQNVMQGRFLRDCLKHRDCPFTSASQGRRFIAGLVARLDSQPYRRGDRKLSGSRAIGLMESANYSPASLWPNLRRVLAAAVRGNLRPMLRAAYSDAQMVNPADSQYLDVVCTDFQQTRKPRRPQRLAPRWQRIAPFSGANRAWSLQPCETWPVAPVRKPHPIRARGSGPILVTGNRFDPATPITWSRALGRQLRHARFLAVREQGHLSWWTNRCARARMTRFMLTGDRPAPGTVCR